MSLPGSSTYGVGDPYSVPQGDPYDDGHHDRGQYDGDQYQVRPYENPAGEYPQQHAPSAAYDEHYAAQVARPRRAYAHTNDTADTQRGYTFGHGARQVRIRPVAFWICVGTLVIMAGWSAVTATYFAFHDDVLARLIARQAAMQFAYEDRIADMRAQVDRVTSRQLLDQEQFEQRLTQLAERQSALEARTSSLGALTEPVITGSTRQPSRSLAPRAPAGAPKPSPINATTAPLPPPDRESLLMSDGVAGALTRVQASLDRVEAGQNAAIEALAASYDGKLKRLRGVLAELGVRSELRPPGEAVGGPFVPYRLPANADAFERQIHRVTLERAQADQLAHEMAALPIRKPVPGELDTSSGFGVRIDPFLNRPAMHTGIDFRGTIGEPVHATAAGTVTIASWSGGYGRMVEIDHGNGLATRYGHLSEIDVKVGQKVRIGQEIGHLGSTGRSTGPHLHYETRINGEAVDPDRFLRAGMRLGWIQ
ncbi:MAG TPA: peptidoglycan DD-metalloendopeptidase family protein [Xanthobacteraceae bacterium]|nr:peptidoglycan DD-metalloendopeptidase family protein [Xanthobacteraceae bacterium]